MLKDTNCAYCMEGELVAKFGIKICELESSLVFLFKEQSHPGRIIVAHKNHVSELVDLSDEERNVYFADIAKVAKAMHTVFQPEKINYGAYGDTGRHLHFHLVPKYKDEFEWGGVFAMNPEKTFLTNEEYNILIQKIKDNL
jgi:diadenosine tetraphosphate (Ap4A) HIT family hydrolase